MTVDLTSVSGSISAEWFYPATGAFARGGDVEGGARRELSAPFTLFRGDVVLRLAQKPESSRK